MGVYQYKDGKLNSIAGAENAAQVYYDNTGTSLSATNAQDAITELNNDLSEFSFRNNNGTAQYSMDDGTTWVNFKNPTGTKSITANGTYDVTDYASAKVNVQQIPWLVTCSQYYTTSDGWYGNLRFDKIGQSGAVGRYVVATNMTTATISGIMSLKYNSPSNVTLTPLVNMKMITVNTGGTTTGANAPTVQNLTANTPITVDSGTPFTIFIPR